MTGLYLVFIDRPDAGLLCVPYLGLDRLDVISRSIDAAKSRWPGSRVHLIRHLGEVNLGEVEGEQLTGLLNLAENLAFQGLNHAPPPVQRKLSDSIEPLHRVLDELMRKESLREQSP